MAERPFASEHAYSFGAFRLLRERQLLLEGEQPVRLGSRAFAILVTLIDRAGEVVSKDDIMARVWPPDGRRVEFAGAYRGVTQSVG